MSQDRQFYTTFFVIMGALLVLCIVLIIIAGNITSDVAEYKPDEVVIENIKPVGKVNVAGESQVDEMPSSNAALAAAAAAESSAGAVAPAAAKSGKDVYNSNCMGCHGTGAAGAPKLGDAAAWAPRIAAGMDSLFNNAVNGLNAMPPKGLCMGCSDDELRAAVEYMVENSR